MAPKFLSTHSRRVRLAAWGHRVQSPVYFNPRTHMECDRSITFLRLTSGLISIHALTWSATLAFWLSRRGLLFQSTHSHGVRPRKRPNIQRGRGHFNPRTHMECDVGAKVIMTVRHISIHALTWSATQCWYLTHGHYRISIHALTWSATAIRTYRTAERAISIHALTWSATRLPIL